MTSLKHVLNDEDSEGSTPALTSQSTLRDSPFGNFQSDDVTFPEGDWQSLFTDLLSSDLNHGAFFDPDFDDAFNVAKSSVAEWAAEALPTAHLDTHLGPALPCDDACTSQNLAAQTQVCYGMIYRVMIKLHGDMSRLHQKLKADDIQRIGARAVLEVQQSGRLQVSLVFPDKTDFAQVNNLHAQVFDEILQNRSIQLEALVDLVAFKQTIEKASNANEAKMRVNVNVYGSRDEVEALGKLLSKEKIFLQDPDHPRADLGYVNPHLFEAPEAEFVPPQSFVPARETEAQAEDSKDSFREAVEDIYASLKRDTDLEQIGGDARLRTELLPHQQKALDFMTQREAGPVPERYCLWQKTEENGQECYRHSITNLLLPQRPPETGGGVLADTMGLGKTLSVLAIVAKSMDEARVWEKDEEQALSKNIPETKKSSRGTLVIVSSFLVLNHWLAEIDGHLDGSLFIYKHHGSNRKRNSAEIADYDIVLTTYFTLAEELRTGRSPLRDIAWFRIVLDEAHIIRRRATHLYRTVSELSGNYRWCLTGTPIQNRLEDVGALFCFIGLPPFDRMSAFRKYIAIPFDEKDEKRALAAKRLGLLFDSLCLRRTEDAVENLPRQQEETRYLHLSDAERSQYEATKAAMSRAMGQSVGEFDRKHDFGLFQAQLHLRLLCNHGTFQNPFSWMNQRNMAMEREAALEFFGQTGEVACSSCTHSMPIMANNALYQTWSDMCKHIVCNRCVSEFSKLNSTTRPEGYLPCPVCRQTGVGPISDKIRSRVEHQHEEYFLRDEGFSTKMKALTDDVHQDLWSSKSLVFSFWTRTLDLIARHFGQRGIPFHRIDGTTPLSSRQRLLEDFSKNPKSPVLMMTTGTGAFGLNLPAANRVFIVEPLFNPATERQAIARAVRLGRKHSITVTRYVIQDTVEKDMRSQQKNKLRLAEIAWEG